MMEFVKSDKGKEKVIFEGYVYVKQKNLANGVVSFECERRRNKAECKAKIKIRGEELVGRLNEHAHGPDPARKEVLKAIQQMKRLAEETEEAPQQIITQSVSTISEDAKGKLPTVHHLRRNVRRHRQAVNNPLPVPQTVDEIVIPDRYKVTHDGQDFLLFDSGSDDNNRMLIFGTRDNIRLLETTAHWFLDGTFKTAPALFVQLYTVHALVNGRTIPCIYALLQNKTQETYIRLFEKLTTLNVNLKPTSIMIDFELAVINSLERIFPDCEIKGCFFHLSQNIYRKIQENGLQQRYQEDPDFALNLRMIPALAFVPTDEVVGAFEELSDILPQECRPVADYFEDSYIGRPQRRGRRQPTYAIEMWNMHRRSEAELPKTNNSVEGWHRSFQSNVGSFHPTIWKFIGFIQREQALQQVHCTQILAGHPSQPPRKKYADSNARILTIVRSYRDRNILDYLRGIAHNLSW